MADITATVVGFEMATTKWNSQLKVEEPATPVVFVKLLMPDGTYSRVSQYVSEKSMESGWPEKILKAQGLENILRLMPIVGKKVAVWEKPSDNPQYPRPSLQFAQKPPQEPPAFPDYPSQGAGPQAYPSQPMPQGELPHMPPPREEHNPFNDSY